VSGPETQYARPYAQRLLQDLGVTTSLAARPEVHPAQAWAESGNMALTGEPDGPGLMCPVPLASYADGILLALAALAPGAPLAGIDGGRLLSERAALSGYRRGGGVAPGGSCRLLRAEGGWLAVNLARTSDWELVPAWLEAGALADWAAVAREVGSHPLAACVERGRLLGLPVAALEPRGEPMGHWFEEHFRSGTSPGARGRSPLVVDLSALWAGPLCTHLLQLMGARVIKVESRARPDGMRAAAHGFYDLLNAGKESVALDFADGAALQQLRRLIARADIVIEASRARALRQLGIHAEELLAAHPQLTWVAISGYGRSGPGAQWVAFGDDGGVAGGLSQVMLECTGRALFCGDAIADPLTGMHAALAAWSSYRQGGGRLLGLALRDVIAHGVRFAGLQERGALRARCAEWTRRVASAQVLAPQPRAITASARPSGADTQAVLAELARAH
jgi:crotonobetainyl-CoA:carnitine CoA-transferase CaiB-like acyl-CoA transferase